tara:strand:+ start:2929 stop:3117 length:189 start_codon:yes stop_codon:yes gene_type:complete
MILSLLIDKIFGLVLKGLGSIYSKYLDRKHFNKVKKEELQKVKDVKDAKDADTRRDAIRKLD